MSPIMMLVLAAIFSIVPVSPAGMFAGPPPAPAWGTGVPLRVTAPAVPVTFSPGPYGQVTPPSEAVLDPEPESDAQVEVVSILEDLGRLDEWSCVERLFDRESGWDPDARGDADLGGSYGLPQRHAPVWGTPPKPWPVEDQVAWAVSYADDRYGDLCKAWDAWKSRATKTSDGWRGGWW